MGEDENIKNPSGLSEFFNALSKEKNDVRQKIKEKIDDPKSGLSGLFNQLEEALQETKKVSVEEVSVEEVSVEEVSENTGRPEGTGLSPEDQNKLDVFSNLLNSFGSDKEIPAFVEELEPEELIPEELVVESEEPQDITEPQNDIITSVIRNLDDMSKKTHVKEEVDQISSIRKEFDNFRKFISQQLGSLQISGAGSGEVQLKFLDDVSTSGQEDGDVLTYNSTTDKYELKSSTSTVSAGQLLEETDGSNILLGATDASGSDDGDDILLEIGVGGSRDIDQTVLQELTSNIIPAQGGAIDLGSPTKRFKNIYLEADTIDLDGATIKSDGSGEITISADGATFPVGSKDGDGKVLLAATAISETSGVLALQIPRSVPLFTQTSGLTTAAVNLTFSAVVKNRSVYTNSGHTFILSNGSDRVDGSVELFEF
tara:strand:+ start:19 stop:1302 length:1284 start_codon:yes stop_codon:yes gene_type:complete